MVEMKTGRLFRLSLDLYTALVDQTPENESNLYKNNKKYIINC